MKYDRGVIVAGFNAELSLQSRDGNTHSLLCDCPEDMNHIMDLLAARARRMLTAYIEHIRKGHALDRESIDALDSMPFLTSDGQHE